MIRSHGAASAIAVVVIKSDIEEVNASSFLPERGQQVPNAAKLNAFHHL